MRWPGLCRLGVPPCCPRLWRGKRWDWGWPSPTCLSLVRQRRPQELPGASASVPTSLQLCRAHSSPDAASRPALVSLQASHFFWALWALIQNQYSTIDFDFLRWVQGPAGRECGGKEELEAKASQAEGPGPTPCPQGRSAAPGRAQLPTLWPCSGPQHVAASGILSISPQPKIVFPSRLEQGPPPAVPRSA